jgi:probable HAF family extracellular repeat protein
MRRMVAAACAVAGLLPAVAGAQYSITNLGTLGGDFSVGIAVNDAGQVAGRSNIAGNAKTHPFLFSNGTMADLGTLGGDNGGAVEINAQGHVVGYAEDANLENHAFLWKNGMMLSLYPPEQSYAGGIDANDHVVGSIGEPEAGTTGVLFQNGGVVYLPHGTFDGILPAAINGAGQIGGGCYTEYSGPNRACLITNGILQVLSSDDSAGYAMNAAGDLCGYATVQQQARPIVWRNGVQIDLGVPAGATSAQCKAINDFGQEIGDAQEPYQTTPLGTGDHAFLVDAVNGPQDLNQLVPQGSPVLTQAFGISNNGLIVALCVYEGTHERACLLKPDPWLILKREIFALEQGDPGCIVCRLVLDPEARALPESLTGLTPAQRVRVTVTLDLMILQLRTLARVGTITQLQAQLLVHQSQLTRSEVAADRGTTAAMVAQ